MKQVIYETKGRAREFNELAINLYTGCGHRCIYCYGAEVTHQDKAAWENNPRPRVTADEIERAAWAWGHKNPNGRHDKRPILLCFVTDPYQPITEQLSLTRTCIEILKAHGLRVTILSKGGKRAMRDFDLLVPGQDAVATTLTNTNSEESIKWEPMAALPWERIYCIKEAHHLGLETWVSFEPIIHPKAVYDLLNQTHEFVGHYKVGTMNYHPHGKTINWHDFGWGIKRAMDTLGVRYYLKNDLRREMAPGAPPPWGGPVECGHWTGRTKDCPRFESCMYNYYERCKYA